MLYNICYMRYVMLYNKCYMTCYGMLDNMCYGMLYNICYVI